MNIQPREETNPQLTPDYTLWAIKSVLEAINFKANSTVYKFIRTKGFPEPIKIGNKSRWRKSDVLNWIDEQPKLETA